MSQQPGKVSLESMPIGLLKHFIPHPLDDQVVKEHSPDEPRWLPIKPTAWEHTSNEQSLDAMGLSKAKLQQAVLFNIRPPPSQLQLGYYASREEAFETLHALSQTSRRIRAYTLPLLWAVVHSFVFLWELDGNYDFYEHYPAAQGTMLEMAFRDRRQLWAEASKVFGTDIEWQDYGDNDGSGQHSFEHNGKEFQEPGRPAVRQAQGASPQLDWRAPRTDVTGPDGKGPNCLVKNGAQLKDCLVEVISQFSALRTFGWCTAVTPMPAGVCDALAKLTTLSSLHLYMVSVRGSVHALPLWKMAGQLETLSTYFHKARSPGQGTSEDAAVDMTSVVLPAKSPTDWKAINALHDRIVARTIIAAARGGKLRCLASDLMHHGPFAVRSLLPYWVGVESWMFGHAKPESWLGAAQLLRDLLAYVSTARRSRRLTCEDVMGLHARFKKHGVPTIIAGQDEQPFMLYLPWLAASEELSQQVADAWNALVVKPPPPALGGKKTAMAEFAAAQGISPDLLAMADKMTANLKAQGLLGDDKRVEDCCIA